jgi:hypothetical protein
MKSNTKNSVEVIIEDLSNHPRCEHGSTILFFVKNTGSKYFACSCYRDVKFCSFKLNFEDFTAGKWKDSSPKRRNHCSDQEFIPINQVSSFLYDLFFALLEDQSFFTGRFWSDPQYNMGLSNRRI